MGETVAVIPARGGSERVPNKNARPLGGVPLLAYSIGAAISSGAFDRILVSSDDSCILEIGRRYGADVVRRPSDLATATSPDIEWVRHSLETLSHLADIQTLAILRPTSPFRTASTIERAMEGWRQSQGSGYTSLRAVEPALQHPGKMWRLHGDDMVPLLVQPEHQPWHDSQYKTLPPVYVQNASLEIVPVATVRDTGTISGGRVLPFLTTGYEGFDINTEFDWKLAEELVESGATSLPKVLPVGVKH